MTKQANFLVVVVVVVWLMVAAPAAEAAITCDGVARALASCLIYLRTGVGPGPACCAGVKALAYAASTPADRKEACVCLKSAGASFTGFYKYAPSLPGRCGVSSPYPISPSTDCNKIH